MKKIISLLSVLFLLACCSKEGAGVSGVWSSSTNDGKLYLELKSGGNGVTYFEGCSSKSAFWSVDGKTIKVTGSAFSKDFVMYEFGSGTIAGDDIMRIEVTITKAYSSDKTKTLTFTRQ